MPSTLVTIVGSGEASLKEQDAAYKVGSLLAGRGVGVVCGGLGGVMEAACKGASEAGGITVGILPGATGSEANPYIGVVIPTGLGEARNTLVVRAGVAVIAIGGEYGTLSEIGFALKIGKRVIGLDTWELNKGGEIDSGIQVARSPEEAVDLALR